jgi:hypothetical protein
MSVHRAILVVLFAFLVAGAAVAATAPGNPDSVTRMYGFCKSPNLSFMSRCAGYIHGFSTMMALVGEASADPGVPSGAKLSRRMACAVRIRFPCRR